MAESIRHSRPRHLARGGPSIRLPRPITSFVGREKELGELGLLLTDPQFQLVNLTGPGGIGKTRLAIEVARRLAVHFPDGVVFVPMANLRNPDALLETLARVIGIHHSAEVDLVERVGSFIGNSRVLFVVDNLEHLLEGVPLLASILSPCPSLTMLTTSRSRLGIEGEKVFEVPALLIHHAVELFEHRARSITREFATTSDSRQAVSNICEHVDRLPLAIELAAARVSVLPPSDLLARLNDRLSMLSEGRRDAPDRHRSMREAIDWSYALLSEPERFLFQRLAVFEGGFTLDAALAIAESETEVISVVSALESGSFIKPVSSPGGPQRFVILQILREYGLERLSATGDEATARQRHADYVTRICADTERLWWNPGGLDKLDEVEPEIPNIRLALEWMKTEGNVRGVLQVAGSLAPLWTSRGYILEGRRWLDWVLPRADDSCAPFLATALRALSWILIQHDEPYRSLVIAQYAVSIAIDTGDQRNRVAALMLSGLATNRLDLLDWSIALLTEANQLMDQCVSESWEPVTRCISRNLLAITHFEHGNLDEAERCSQEMLELQQASDLRLTPASQAWKGLGYVARARGNPRGALTLHLTGLRLAIQVNDVRQVATGLGAAAGAIAALGRYEAAARIFGASEAMHERIDFPFASETFAIQRALGLPQPWSSLYPDCRVAEALRLSLVTRTAPIRRTCLSPVTTQSWWSEGRALDVESALALIEEIESEQSSNRALPGGLSPREHEILQLVADGLTDRQISERLSISPRTVQNHIQHIYQKIHATTRAGATVWAIRHGVTSP